MPPLPALDLDFVAAGALDPRVTFSRASSGTYVDADGILRTAAVDAPRFDFDPATRQPRGLLIEGQRTNAIRNSTMQGAAAGTPGALPTNWAIAGQGLGTLTQQIVGVGAIGSLAYVDVRFSGTTSTTSFRIVHEPGTQVAAAAGQAWTASAFVAIVGGSLSGVGLFLLVTERDSSGTFLAESSADLSGAVSGTLARYSVSRTFTQGATAFCNSGLALTFVSGASIDVTLRIGLPQLEQGAFATSAIPTTNAAATRAADVAAMTGTANVSAWLNAAEGTLVAEAQAPAGGAALAVLDSGAMSDRIQLTAAANYTPSFAVVSGGAVQAELYASPAAAGSVMRVAGAYRFNDFALVGNGGGQLVDTAGSVPAGLAALRLGRFNVGTEPLNGHLRRLRYWRERLPVHMLRGLSAAASSRAAPQPWTPAYLGAALALWLDADDASTVTLNGATVSQWADKSANARHATQGTAAAQPAWGRGRNLLQRSEALKTSPWVNGMAATELVGFGPQGATAWRFETTAGSLYQTFACTPGTAYTFSFDAMLGTVAAADFVFAVRDDTASAFIATDIQPNVTLTSTGFARVTYTVTAPAGCTVLRVYPYRQRAGSGSGTFFISRVQVNPGATAEPYQKTDGAAQAVPTGINGKPTLAWTGANGVFLDTAAWSLAPNRQYATVAVAASPTWGGGNRFGRIWVSRSGYPQGYLGQGEPAGSALAIGGSMLTTAAVTGVSGANVVSHSFGTSGLAANAFDIAVNGGTPVSLTGNTGALGTAGVRIGADLTVTGGGNTLDGQIGEIVIVNTDLTAADRRRLEGYMAHKWGLADKLPAGHPFKSAPPFA